MKNKKVIGIILLAILIVGLMVIGYLKFSKNNDYIYKEEKNIEEFIIDNENKYLIRTNDQFMTMQNEGGSHVDTYYEIDLAKKASIKKQDRYKGFEGWVYQGKVLNKKVLTDKEISDLKEIFDNIIANKDSKVEDKLDFSYYTLSTKDYEEIKIYDKQTKQDILEIVE